MDGGETRIIHSVFLDNELSARGSVGFEEATYGGALYAAGPLTLEECAVSGNSVTCNCSIAYGGGIYSTTNLSLRNVLVVGNVATGSIDAAQSGDGIYVAAGRVTMTNCTVASNDGEGVVSVSGVAGTISVINSIFWGNGDDVVNFPKSGDGSLANVRYCDFQSGENVGTNGSVSIEPLFVDSIYYHLQSRQGNYVGGYFSGGSWDSDLDDSPLIDAGDPESDWSREPYPHGRCANMGAYGNTAVASKTFIRGTLMYFR